MIPKKGTLSFSKKEGWVIFTSDQKHLKVHKNIILDFGLKKNNHYYRTCYYYNSYGDLCIWLNKHCFSLDKTMNYDIKYETTTQY